MLKYLIAAIIGYSFGIIQTGFLLGKIIYKKDIRDHGSGNAGASNVLAIFGKKAGVVTGIVDISKAVAAMYLIRIMYLSNVETEVFWNLSYITGFMVIIGHNFPFYMKFRGGKGAASLVGTMFLVDVRLGIAGVLVMTAVSLITDYIALGTMSLLFVILVYTMIFRFTPVTVTLVFLLISMGIYKHHSNFVRIKNKEETRIRGTLY